MKSLFDLRAIRSYQAFSHAPNELISATVDLSNLTSTASQLPTSKGLTPTTLHYSMSVLGIPKLDYQFI